MARADTASASLRSDSIKGLAQSIANPAYRRLLTAEPLLRRAVPVLIVAFMLTICIGAAVQVLEHRRQVVFDATQTIEALADHFAAELDRPSRDGKSHIARTSDALEPGAADVGGGRRPAHPRRRRRRHHRRQHAERAADRGAQYPRRARTVSAADHARRRRRHARNHHGGRRRRFRHGAGAEKSGWSPRRHPEPRRRARQLALDHRAHRHAVGHDRFRGADPRLRLPLAGDARTGGRSDP